MASADRPIKSVMIVQNVFKFYQTVLHRNLLTMLSPNNMFILRNEYLEIRMVNFSVIKSFLT